MARRDRPSATRRCPAIDDWSRPDSQAEHVTIATVMGSLLDELLAAVDVEGRAGDRGIGHQVDGQCEEPLELIEVGGVEGGAAGPELGAAAVQAIGVTRRDDHLGTPGPGEPGRLEPDARASADGNDRLSGEVRLALPG